MAEGLSQNSVGKFVGVLGTAGHIDHGKTALITALTGVDTDRLPEEKDRGITIELGFTVLELEGIGALSVIDVPGHEALVRTMVAGATGIDLVLLVVAADEGVMPQTREHVAICNLLGINRAVVALTKSDLVDSEMIELATEEVRDLLIPTTMRNAQILPVSAKNEMGIEALRRALIEAVARPKDQPTDTGLPRLAVDRAFAMRGFGAVVTGTLNGDTLRNGETVEIWPQGETAKIRGLQSHGKARPEIAGGSRCAINLQGIEVSELARGQVVTRRGTLRPTACVDAAVEWLAGFAPSGGITSVEFLAGTAERRARVAPIGQTLNPSSEKDLARIHIDGDPLVLLPGDRFILRGFARTPLAGATLGGGIVLDATPPPRRRSDPQLFEELKRLQDGKLSTALRERITRSGLSGLDERVLAREVGRRSEDLEPTLNALVAEGALRRAGRHLYLAGPAFLNLKTRLERALDEFHAREPMRPGMQRAALLGSLPDNVPSEIADSCLRGLAEQGEVEIDGDHVRRRDHQPVIDPETQQLLDRIIQDARQAGLEAANSRDWSEALGVTTERFRDLVAHLERERQLIRAPGDIWFDPAVVDSIRQIVLAYFENNQTLDTPTYKSLIGTTRRTAVPLMELLDEMQITRRRGEVRVLMKG
ncbi:selenocysteine-specific translation elongation factor [Myxococcota bacterium]|nr:selenocysteine-specific translation elongation factor [Myxococcota bacterium]